MLSEKGKHASATENRRFVWKEIVWPLVIEHNSAEFTLIQYQKKRDEICTKYGISVNALSRGLASLIQRGLLYKENQSYFIHYRLIAYMRLKADVDYGTAEALTTYGIIGVKVWVYKGEIIGDPIKEGVST